MAKKPKRRKPSSKRSSLARRSNLARVDEQVSIEQFVARQREQGELSEDAAMEMVWEMHPDLNRMRLDDTLPDELIDADGNVWSPRMHIDMHAIVERQLANNDPDGIADLAIRYEQEKKLDSHEIRHALAAAVGDQLWYMSKEHCPFDCQRYFHDIERSYQNFLQAKN